MRPAVSPGLHELLEDRDDLRSLYEEMTERIWTTTQVDPVLLELCRLRIAQLHRCRAALAERTPVALAAGLDESLVAALPNWHVDPAFAGARRAALALCEKFVMDVHAITDEEAAAVVAEIGEPATVGLMLALGVFDGATRLRSILHLTQEV